MKYVPVNFEMIKHPTNWIIVLLMVILGGFALEALTRWYRANIGPRLPESVSNLQSMA